jgi:FKBP-type peptidyl-prolyl cis-trans isomerase FkpA
MRFQLLAFSLAATLAACTPSEPRGPSYPANETYAASLQINIPSMTKVDTNLYYQDITLGTGAAAAVNKLVTITYTGYLTDGTSFDSGTLTDHPLNNSNLIEGMVQGVAHGGMKVGGRRKLAIGSIYGYGAKGSAPKIPGNATIVFDIELKGVK